MMTTMMMMQFMAMMKIRETVIPEGSIILHHTFLPASQY
jgi:hypothetical protein